MLPSNESNDQGTKSLEKSLCKFYHQGNCKHGKSGKGCAFSHPPLCRKLLNHGHNDKRGCKHSSDECKFHHPVMCKSSLNKGVCYKKDCNKYHVRGTERERNKKAQQTASIPSSKNQSKKKVTDPNSQTFDFLDYLKEFKEQVILEMDKRLYNMMFPPLSPQVQPFQYPRLFQAGYPNLNQQMSMENTR